MNGFFGDVDTTVFDNTVLVVPLGLASLGIVPGVTPTFSLWTCSAYAPDGTNVIDRVAPFSADPCAPAYRFDGAVPGSLWFAGAPGAGVTVHRSPTETAPGPRTPPLLVLHSHNASPTARCTRRGRAGRSTSALVRPRSAASSSISDPVSIKLLRWTSKTLLTLSKRSGPAGAAVTASVEVRGGFGTPSGTVEILDAEKVIATGMLVVVIGGRSSSTVAITLAGTLAAGRHTLTAVFAGNDVLHPSRGSASYRFGPLRT